jgi:pSer/pThr/pTyr-binding forkhead associated (FHA) protein
VFCTQCGSAVPTGSNFCPTCGTALDAAARASTVQPEAATGAIDLAHLDESVPVDDLPDLPAGTALLAVVHGPNAGSRYLLDRDRTEVGRHPDSHVYLDDVTVSRHHARVDREDAAFVLYDLGSLNGTYLGGERVERRTLRPADEVQVGRFKLLFVRGGQ